MSDFIQHECGIALIRLKKPLQYYEQAYGNVLWGFHKLFLLMEKQHNRGQDGAGIGAVKLDMPLGQSYMFRERTLEDNALARLFRRQLKRYDRMVRSGRIIPEFAPTVKEHFDFGAELLMGHLRYGTSGAFVEESCHPYLRQSNWPTRNLMVAGNFNMTNTRQLNEQLIQRGQHPIFDTDTQTILEEIGFHLDEAHQALYHAARDEGIPGAEIPAAISQKLEIASVLREAAVSWDGGYAIAGVVGNGDAFVLRDPNGIRPAHYIETDDYIAFASERVPLMTGFEVEADEVKEVPPGHVVTIKSTGALQVVPFKEAGEKTPCSFERIYFSRGNDPRIYREREALGELLVPQMLKAIGHDFRNTVFSYIPNTAEVAFYGAMNALRRSHRTHAKERILQAFRENRLDEALVDEALMDNWPRVEKLAIKDVKLRTFISKEDDRNQLVSHVYDVTYGVIQPSDTLIVLDDSIVRGTTLRESILKMLSRTRPKRIVIVSTAPQIRYPDCYGIDMSEIGKFVAFQAAVALLRERRQTALLEQVYAAARKELLKPPPEQVNVVQRIYEPFDTETVSAKIAQLLKPRDIPWQGEVTILYQTIENLRRAIPEHHGDWYFTGNYPTPGGGAVCNQAYVHYFENRSGRSYDMTLSA